MDLFFQNMIEKSRKDSEILVLIQAKNIDELFIIRCTGLGLTKREIEICDLVREGRIYKEIANVILVGNYF